MYDTRDDFNEPNPTCGNCQYTEWTPIKCNSNNKWNASRSIKDSKMTGYCTDTNTITYDRCDYCLSGLSDSQIYYNAYAETDCYKHTNFSCPVKNDLCNNKNLNSSGNIGRSLANKCNWFGYPPCSCACVTECAIHQSCNAVTSTRTFWNVGQPDDSNGEDYGEMVNYESYTDEYAGWNDNDGGHAYRGICEYEDESTGDFKYGGHSYSLSTATGWEAARNECCSEGGYLANIHRYYENRNLYIEFLSDKPVGTRYYIGYSDKASEGDWKWYKCGDLKY